MNNPRISFVVPLFNHLEQTQAMLATLRLSLPATLGCEIILVDDASTDSTGSWLATLDLPHIKKISNPVNLGYARSNNIGVQLARSPILCLLNNDLLFEPGWLEPMLEILEAPGLNAGIVGNVQYRVDDGSLDHAGVTLSATAKFEHTHELTAGASGHAKVLAATGACMLIHKADFIAAGGFDENFVNGCEDVDLCFATRAARKSIYVATTSCIRHYVSLSRGRTSLQNERNSRYLFGKWRQEIKRELAAQWTKLIQAGPAAYANYLSGTLSPEFLATPHGAARTIAEAMLQREQMRWARELSDEDPNIGVANRCKAFGLQFDASRNWYVPLEEFEFALEGLQSARNFYVCGILLHATPSTQDITAITISVNDIQQQTFIVHAGRNINVGIIDPILLPSVVNRFKVVVHKMDNDGRPLGDMSKLIAITHIVVNDQVISTF